MSEGTTTETPETPAQRGKRIAALIVCLLSLALCYGQGLQKALDYASPYAYGSFDFAVLYTASRSWVLGRNPYQPAHFGRTARESGVPDPRLHGLIQVMPNVARTQIPNSSPYPPPQLTAMAPVAALPWQAARSVWWTVSFVALCVIFWTSATLFLPSWSPTARYLLVAALAQSRLIHMTSYRGQTGIAAFGLVLFAVWLLARKRPGWAGAALGLSTFKFTFALPMLLYYGVQKGGAKLTAATLGVTAFLSALALLPVGGASALKDFLAVSKAYIGVGGMNDTSLVNENLRSGIDNVAVILFNLVGMRIGLVNALYGVLLIGWLLLLWRTALRPERAPGDRMLDWALATLGGYLLFYHRYYDAVILFPIAMIALDRWRAHGRPLHFAYLALGGSLVALLYVFSIQSVDERIIAMGYRLLPPFLAPLRVWAFIATFGLLVYLRWRPPISPRETPQDGTTLAR